MQKDRDILIKMGGRIADRRNAIGLSQSTLAEAAGVSLQTIGSAESGLKALRPENIVSVCNALDLDIGYLLTGKYSISSILDDNRLKALDAKQLEALKAIVDSFLSVCVRAQ